MIITFLDAETLGLSQNAVVWELAWGTLDVDPGYSRTPGTEFIGQFNSVLLDVPEQLARGRVIEPETMDFTRRVHGPDFASALLTQEGVRASVALLLLKASCERSTEVWCNGASFDFPLLKSLGETVGVHSPKDQLWNYGKECCLRTVRRTCLDRTKPSALNDAVAHRALADVQWGLETLARLSPGYLQRMEAADRGLHFSQGDPKPGVRLTVDWPQARP